jgi:hypothetical protein
MRRKFSRRAEDRDARRAALEGWAKEQQSRLAAEERRLAAEEQRRLFAEQIPRVLTQARQRTGRVDSLRDAVAIPVVITKPSEVPADRAAVFADLVVSLREYKWADPIVSECDELRCIAPNAIDLARRHHPGAPWLLYMEDDVILGPDFGLLPALLREADDLFPDAGLVSFFSCFIDDPGWSTHLMAEFVSPLCVAIRNTDYLLGFRAFVDAAADGPHYLIDSPDPAVRMFMAVEYDSYALSCPSLVQHTDVTSTYLGEAGSGRISWSYTQAYG